MGLSADVVVKVNSVAVSGITSHTYQGQRGETNKTAYGATAQAFAPQLPGATLQLGGEDPETATTGARAVLEALYNSGASTTVLYQPEGTGTSKPQRSGTAYVMQYQETGAVAGHVQWSASIRFTGAIATAAQS